MWRLRRRVKPRWSQQTNQIFVAYADFYTSIEIVWRYAELQQSLVNNGVRGRVSVNRDVAELLFRQANPLRELLPVKAGRLLQQHEAIAEHLFNYLIRGAH